MSAAELLSKGFSVQELYDGGYTLEEISAADEDGALFDVPDTYSAQMSALSASLTPAPSTRSTTAGIVVGAVAVVCIIIACIIVSKRRNNNSSSSSTTNNNNRAPPAAIVQNQAFDAQHQKGCTQYTLDRFVATQAASTLKPSPKTSLFKRLRGTPAVSLLLAVLKAAEHCNTPKRFDFKAAVKEAESFGATLLKTAPPHSLPTGLTAANIAALHVYTQHTPLYSGLNGALGGWGDGGTAAVPHYLPYAKQFVAAAAKLPRFEGKVYRGIRLPPSAILGGKVVGDILVLPTFVSASTESDVLLDEHFLGMGDLGARTVIQYIVFTAVQIKRYSAMDEGEVVLLPETRVVIDGIKVYDNGVTEIQCHELPPTVPHRQHTAITVEDPLGDFLEGQVEDPYEDIYASTVEDGDYLAPGAQAFAQTPLPAFIYDAVAGTVTAKADTVDYAVYAPSDATAANNAVYDVPDALPEAEVIDLPAARCPKCNTKLQFCTCNVRRGTADMISVQKKGSKQKKGASGQRCMYKKGACTRQQDASSLGAYCTMHACPGCNNEKRSGEEQCGGCALQSSDV